MRFLPPLEGRKSQWHLQNSASMCKLVVLLLKCKGITCCHDKDQTWITKVTHAMWTADTSTKYFCAKNLGTWHLLSDVVMGQKYWVGRRRTKGLNRPNLCGPCCIEHIPSRPEVDTGLPLISTGFTLQNIEVLKSVTLLLHVFQAYSHFMCDLSTFWKVLRSSDSCTGSVQTVQ